MRDIFKNKVVLITGGNSGIGKELAVQLADRGALIYLSGRNNTTGLALANQLSTKGTMAHFLNIDVTESDAVQKMVDMVTQQEGRIDYLFHSAGIILGGEFRDHKLEDIDAVLRTNVLGTSYVNYYVYRKMAEQGSGHIINLSSAAGLFPLPLMGVYSSSKFMVYGFTEALRMEGKGLGVRVSSVAPGIVDTPIYSRGRYSKTDKARAKGLLLNRASAITPEKAAQRIIHGVERNQAVIFTQFYAHGTWLFYRLFPYLFRFFATRYMRPYRDKLRKP